MNGFFETWKKVFFNWKYFFLAVFVFVLFYLFNVIIHNFSGLVSFTSRYGAAQTAAFLIELSVGFKETITMSSFASFIVIGLMLGILFSLIFYKTMMLKDVSGKVGFLGTVGIFLGVFAPGCAACGIGLLSALGFGAAAITFLPFDGLEISFLAIIILGFSIYKITKDIKKEIVCEI